MDLRDRDLLLRPPRPEDARRELGLTRIEILPHKDNAASRRVAEKAGFADTGELVAAPRAGDEEPVYAVYRWTA
jgi:RimJ/RimL family protein N-acetyltransferase